MASDGTKTCGCGGRLKFLKVEGRRRWFTCEACKLSASSGVHDAKAKAHKKRK